MKSSVKTFSTKKLATILVALAVVLATAFACGFTSKSANAATMPNSYSATYYRPTDNEYYIYDIDDAGAFHQKYDEFNWSSIPLSYRELVANGYDYVTVTVKFDMKEKNKGYQQIFLYPTVSGTDSDFIQRIQIEYGGDKLVTNYHTVTINFKSIPLSEFVTYNTLGLVVRYGATGGGEDTWYNKNCSVNVTVSKNITRPKNSATGDNVFIGFDEEYNNP